MDKETLERLSIVLEKCLQAESTLRICPLDCTEVCSWLDEDERFALRLRLADWSYAHIAAMMKDSGSPMANAERARVLATRAERKLRQRLVLLFRSAGPFSNKLKAFYATVLKRHEDAVEFLGFDPAVCPPYIKDKDRETVDPYSTQRSANTAAITQNLLSGNLHNLLDGIFCAHLACYFWHWGEEGCRVVGDMESGYVTLPRYKLPNCPLPARLNR